MTGTMCIAHTLTLCRSSSLWTQSQLVLHPPCMQEEPDLKVALSLPVNHSTLCHCHKPWHE